MVCRARYSAGLSYTRHSEDNLDIQKPQALCVFRLIATRKDDGRLMMNKAAVAAQVRHWTHRQQS